ncbi:MAG: TVP38/TMEM64 family protein [Desulfobacteraceae bacterium]|jgi:uncharacterized membrane protein YdjX (TVP38/TMEM64 family)
MQRINHLWPWMLCAIGLCVFLIYWFREPLLYGLSVSYDLLTNRERVADYVTSYGAGAPFVFMAIQIFQVILAPIPGEATGFIGGYLFGAFTGCFYSTIALTIGSFLNFCIGRFIGKHWVRRIIPQARFDKLDHLIRHQGLLVVFVLFLFPGFPKDYLCLFLGVSTMPMRVFLLQAFLGRIPGTLMLSLQGALVFEKNYLIFCLIVVINLIAVYLAYRHREALYQWVEKINGPPTATIDEDEH